MIEVIVINSMRIIGPIRVINKVIIGIIDLGTIKFINTQVWTTRI